MLMKDLDKKYVSIILSILIALTGICIEKNNTDVFFSCFNDNILTSYLNDKEPFNHDLSAEYDAAKGTVIQANQVITTPERECRIEENTAKILQIFKNSDESKKSSIKGSSMSVIARTTQLSELWSVIIKKFFMQNTVFSNGKEMIISYMHNKDGDKDRIHF